MDGKFFVLYLLPVFTLPMLVDSAVHLWRKSNPNYRVSDLLTNFSLSILSVLGGLVFAGTSLAIYITLYHEVAPLKLDSSAPGTWLLAFLVYDFLYYWLHRAHHRVSILWAVHEVHHSGEDMNYGLAIRQPILGELTSWPFFTPLALIGIAPEVFLGISAVQLLYQYSLHNSYVPRLGPLEKWFQTPALHRVHHASNPHYIDKNYGNILAIWDRIFGSYQAEEPDDPPRYGLTTAIDSWNPWVFNIHFFKHLFAKSRRCKGWAEQLRCWIAAPAWEPRFRPSSQAADPVKRPKYNVALTATATAYCVVQFVGILAVFVLLLWHSEEILTALGVLAILVLLFGTYELGKLLEGNAGVWATQLTRLTLLTAAAMIIGLTSGRLLVIIAITVFVALSAAILLKIRREGFQVSTAKPVFLR